MYHHADILVQRQQSRILERQTQTLREASVADAKLYKKSIELR